LFISVSSRITGDRVDWPDTFCTRNTTNTRGTPGVNFKTYIVMVENEEEKNVGKS